MGKQVFYIAIIISLVLAFVVYDIYSNDKRRNERIKRDYYKGIISGKYLDSQDHYVPKFTLGYDYANNHVFENYGIYERAQIGDSIIKDPGTFRHVLKHGDSVVVYYPKIFGGKEIRD